jgi:hypothetical protein
MAIYEKRINAFEGISFHVPKRSATGCITIYLQISFKFDSPISFIDTIDLPLAIIFKQIKS